MALGTLTRIVRRRVTTAAATPTDWLRPQAQPARRVTPARALAGTRHAAPVLVPAVPPGVFTVVASGGTFVGPTASGTARFIPTYPDLLAALVAYLRADTGVAALVTVGYGAGVYGGQGYGGQPQVWTEEAPADATPPFLLIYGYTDTPPRTGSGDLDQAEGTIQAVANTLDAARLLGKAVKAAIDRDPADPSAFALEPLTWVGGSVVAAVRGKSVVDKLPGVGRGGYVFVEDMDYTFWTETD